MRRYLSCRPNAASTTPRDQRAAPFDPVVLPEIGTPPTMTQRVLLAGSRPPCAEAGGARFRSRRDPCVNEDLPGRGRLLRREAIALHEPCEVIGHSKVAPS